MIPIPISAPAPATACPRSAALNSIPSATCWTRRKCCARKRCTKRTRPDTSTTATSGPAGQGTDKNEVVIGISPAFGLKLYQTTAGHRLSEVLGAMIEAIRERGLKPASCASSTRPIRHSSAFRRRGFPAGASASAFRPRAPPSSTSATACRTTISNCFPTRRSPGSSTIAGLAPMPRPMRWAKCRNPSWCRRAARPWARATTPASR